jgi:gluconate 2-dehydrogenase gamma chain
MMGSAPYEDSALLFFSRSEALIVDTLTSEFLPSEDGSPGATEAGVTTYIDMALAGFMRDLQGVYRRGFTALADLTSNRFGTTFVDATGAQRTLLMLEMSELSERAPDVFLGQFFRIVREHTIQGFFGDPAYGGNRDTVGWKLVGFPGAQWGYSHEQMQPDVDSRSIPILTVRDLYARIGRPND